MPPIPVRPPRVLSDVVPSSLTAFLGDSITKGNGDSGGNITVFGGRSYPIIATQLAMGALRPYIVAGVIGERTDQMLDRVSSQIVNLRTPKPGRCIVLGGTNDVSQAVTPTTSLGYLEQIYRTLRGARIEPIGATIPPYAGARQRVAWLNAGILDLCDRLGMICLDFHDAMVDPSTGGFRSGLDDDGTHPGPAGQRAMGAVVAAALAQLPRYVPAPLVRDNADSVNLIDGGCFLTDTNADGVGEYWVNNATTGGGTVNTSLESGDINILGNWQVMEQTVAGKKQITQTIPAGTTSPRGWSVGDVLEFHCLIAATVESGELDPAIELIASGAGVSYAPVYAQSADVTRGYVYQRFTVPSGTTSLLCRLTSSVSSAGTGTFKVAQATLLNLTRLGVA